MVPRGQVIHHQQTCRAQQRVVPTISRSSGSSKVHFKVLRGGGVEHHKRRWGVIYEGDIGSAWEWCQINLHASCDVPATLHHLNTTVVGDARSIFAPTLVACPDQKHFPKNAPGTIVKGRWGVSMDVEWSTAVALEHPWYHGVTLYTISRRAEHKSESYQRYLDHLDLAKFI